MDLVIAMRVSKAKIQEQFERLFDGARCAVAGCDRRPLGRSRFCGCCLEDRHTGRTVIFHGGEMLPARREAPKPFTGKPNYWDVSETSQTQ